MSLIFKEKLNLEGKRRYERQKEGNEAVARQLQSVYGELSQLWDRIFQKMEKAGCGCEPNCWKQEVMKRCKEQLVEQRRILQEEEKQIETEYDTMRNLAEQIKKVFISVHQQEPPRRHPDADDARK